MDSETLEKFAIRVALGNNGGTWATHYVEAQKEHWRQFVRDLENAVVSAIHQRGMMIVPSRALEGS